MVGLRVRERVHVSSGTSKRLCRSIFVCLLTTRIMVLLMKMMLFRVKMPMTGTPIVQQTMMLSIWCHHCHVNDDVMATAAVVLLASIVRFSFVCRSRWQFVHRRRRFENHAHNKPCISGSAVLCCLPNMAPNVQVQVMLIFWCWFVMHFVASVATVSSSTYKVFCSQVKRVMTPHGGKVSSPSLAVFSCDVVVTIYFWSCIKYSLHTAIVMPRIIISFMQHLKSFRFSSLVRSFVFLRLNIKLWCATKTVQQTMNIQTFP